MEQSQYFEQDAAQLEHAKLARYYATLRTAWTIIDTMDFDNPDALKEAEMIAQQLAEKIGNKEVITYKILNSTDLSQIATLENTDFKTIRENIPEVEETKDSLACVDLGGVLDFVTVYRKLIKKEVFRLMVALRPLSGKKQVEGLISDWKFILEYGIDYSSIEKFISAIYEIHKNGDLPVKKGRSAQNELLEMVAALGSQPSDDAEPAEFIPCKTEIPITRFDGDNRLEKIKYPTTPDQIIGLSFELNQGDVMEKLKTKRSITEANFTTVLEQDHNLVILDILATDHTFYNKKDMADRGVTNFLEYLNKYFEVKFGESLSINNLHRLMHDCLLQEFMSMPVVGPQIGSLYITLYKGILSRIHGVDTEILKGIEIELKKPQ